jgi:SMI1/KNR4 family protein SUKH-1
MADLQKILNRLTTLPKFQAERPADKDEIQRIEAELGVVLPQQYVEFLQRFGYARWFGQIIYGIRPTDRATGRASTVISDCVSRTKKEQDPNNPLGTTHLPRDHVVIATDGGGGNYVLFTVGSPHEGQVHYYNFEDQAEPIQVWKTFQDYLESRIEEATGA